MLNIINKLGLFADDTKMMSKILNANSNICLQDDLNKLLKWLNEWSIKFNEDKFFDSISRNRHNKRLHRESVKTGKTRCRHHFLTNRVVKDLNSLTQEAIK